jgi:hypothetical protein
MLPDKRKIMGELTDEERNLLRVAAKHEAGHAVMRWILELPLTELTATVGTGMCAGTKAKVQVKDYLLVTLAGLAAESNYGFYQPDFSSRDGGDLDRARLMLVQIPWLRIWPDRSLNAVTHMAVPEHYQSTDDAFQRYFMEACDNLAPHEDLVNEIATRLAVERKLTARTVAAMCRRYATRNKMNE